MKRVLGAGCWVLSAVLSAWVLSAVPGAVPSAAPGAVPGAGMRAQRARPSDRPEKAFKLATFEAAGKTRVGLVMEARVLDIAGANDALVKAAGVPTVRLPSEMRELIEQYDRVKPRLYQIANYYTTASTDPSFAFDLASVAVKAPIKYP